MTINCKGYLIDVSSPKVMGILNLTPDSFYDGGTYTNERSIVNRVEKMLLEGATFIDVGGYSSRPGADHVSSTEEEQRIVPIVKVLMKEFPNILLSIDTFRSKIASICLKEGAAIINDISAGQQDEKMFKVVSEHNAPMVMMHMRGMPQTMQHKTNYNNLLIDIMQYFSERLSAARLHNISDLIIDPGFGFSKTIDQNYELLGKTELLKSFELPILIGLSRKSMIYKTLGSSAQEALNGTTALHMVALQKGGNILRVHDVKEAMECIRLQAHLM